MKAFVLIEAILNLLQATEEIETLSNEAKKDFVYRIEEMRKQLFWLGHFDNKKYSQLLDERELLLIHSIVW